MQARHGTEKTDTALRPGTAGTARHGTAEHGLVWPTQGQKGLLENGTPKTFGPHNQHIPPAPELADTAR